MNKTVQTKQTILTILAKKDAEMKALGVRKLGLFGSFARNEETPESDIDVLVEFEPGQKTFDNFMQLVFLLEDSLERPVELVTPESLSPYLRPHIINEVEYVPLVA